MIQGQGPPRSYFSSYHNSTDTTCGLSLNTWPHPFHSIARSVDRPPLEDPIGRAFPISPFLKLTYTVFPVRVPHYITLHLGQRIAGTASGLVGPSREEGANKAHLPRLLTASIALLSSLTTSSLLLIHC